LLGAIVEKLSSLANKKPAWEKKSYRLVLTAQRTRVIEGEHRWSRFLVPPDLRQWPASLIDRRP